MVLLCENQVCLEAGTFRQPEVVVDAHPFVVLEAGEEQVVLERSQDVGEGGNLFVQERIQAKLTGWGTVL